MSPSHWPQRERGYLVPQPQYKASGPSLARVTGLANHCARERGHTNRLVASTQNPSWGRMEPAWEAASLWTGTTIQVPPSGFSSSWLPQCLDCFVHSLTFIVSLPFPLLGDKPDHPQTSCTPWQHTLPKSPKHPGKGLLRQAPLTSGVLSGPVSRRQGWGHCSLCPLLGVYCVLFLGPFSWESFKQDP